MLTIIIPAEVREDFDDETSEFVYTIVSEEQTLKLEHSLVSLSKWESKWCKPFLTKTAKTNEELLDYIKCMTITQNVKDETYMRLSEENIRQINEYIDAPMTATTFSEESGGKKNRRIVTSELIYYWMIASNIPSQYEKWHLNRLLTLIKVCSIENEPPKKNRKRNKPTDYAAMNAARKKKLNTKG